MGMDIAGDKCKNPNDISERKSLRGIFGLEKKNTKNNAERREMFNEPDIVDILKTRIFSRTKRVQRIR